MGAMPELGQLFVTPVKRCSWISHYPAGTQRVEHFLLPADQAGHSLDHAVPSLLHPSFFLGDVWNHMLCRIGRRPRLE
jgi:hypothetical protein